MRLLVTTDQWSPDVVGGSARVAAETARALARRGHEVVVLAPSVAGLPAIERNGSLELRRALRRGPVPQTFADVAETYRLARRERGRFDVVLAHQSTNAVGVLAARTGAPVALVFHASVPLEQRFMRTRLPPAQHAVRLALAPVFTLLERRAVDGAARILVLSEFSRDLLVEAHPDTVARVVAVGGGIDTSSFSARLDRAETRERLGAGGGTRLLLAVRRLEPRMGLEQLLRATGLLRGRGADVLLAVAGDGQLARPLRRLAQELDLEEHVRFLGRVSEDELRRLYAAADVAVLPTVAYEGFGMSTVEALASGTPVVGTPVGATPELLRPLDEGLVAAGTEPEDLAGAIAEMLDRADPAFRERCATYARTRYDWERAILAWEDALASLV